MRVMVIVKATKSSEGGQMPSAELLSEMGKFNEELIKEGIMQAGDGLRASSHGARVYFSGKDRTVKKGPFPETADLIAGFWIWNVRSLEEAVSWAKRCPDPSGEQGQLEIRPLLEPSAT